MAMVEWRVQGREFANCNCAYGCPCQFNALPTHGDCKAVCGFDIAEGHHGKTRIDGLRAVAVLSWPGPIHEGKGEAFIIIDQRAKPHQREALLRILTGQDTEPGATDDVRAAWRELIGDRAWIRTRDEAIAEGWFGPVVEPHVRDRIGDLVVAARTEFAIVQSRVTPRLSELIGHHGSLTDAEQLVPLLVYRPD